MHCLLKVHVSKFSYLPADANIPMIMFVMCLNFTVLCLISSLRCPSHNVAVIFHTYFAMSVINRILSFFQPSDPVYDARKKSTVLQYLKRDVDPESIWEVVGVLGDGSFGKVYQVQAFLLAF